MLRALVWFGDNELEVVALEWHGCGRCWKRVQPRYEGASYNEAQWKRYQRATKYGSGIGASPNDYL